MNLINEDYTFPSLFDFSEEDKDMLEYIKENSNSLKISFRNKLGTLEKTLEVIAEGVLEAKRKKMTTVQEIWNVAGYINTCSFDLAVSGELLMFESDPWKKRYFARMSAIHIYEALQDIPNMIGKDFREKIEGVTGGSDFLTELGKKAKSLSQYKSSHAKWLKEIRICCAAHRDKQLESQLKIVFKISPTTVLMRMAEFDSILNELGHIFQRGMNLGLES